jgi:hypothetical protein
MAPASFQALMGTANPFNLALATFDRKQDRTAAAESTLSAAVHSAMNAPAPGKVVPAAPAEGGIKLYSKEFYVTCAIGGMVSCGATHTAVTPLDVVKCNMQTDPKKYSSIGIGFRCTAVWGKACWYSMHTVACLACTASAEAPALHLAMCPPVTGCCT